MTREKKALLLLWTYIIIIFTPKTKSHSKTITYNDNQICQEEPYAKYDNIDIYIIDVDTAKELDNDSNAIYIIDDRCDDDPDMSVCDSYRFSKEEINDLIDLLLKYEENNSSEWNRTIKSMKNEWIFHNICYKLHIQKSRTKQVDFNNSDEETYLDYLKIIREILKTNNTEIENIKTRALIKNN